MLFRKNKKEAAQEEAVLAADVQGSSEHGSAVPVRKRRKRTTERKTATVEEIKQVVRKPVFKSTVADAGGHVKTIGTAPPEADKESSPLEMPLSKPSSDSSGERTVVMKQRGYFTVPEEEKAVKVADVSSDIASAFGIISSGQGSVEEAELPAGNLAGESSILENAESVFQADGKEMPEEDTIDVQTVDMGTDSDRDEAPAGIQCSLRISAKLKELLEQGRHPIRGRKSIEVFYYDSDAEDVETEDGKFLLANNKVFVNGKLACWDDLFEVKVPAGTKVEIETGIGFGIPSGCRLGIGCSEEASSKFYFRSAYYEVDSCDASDSIIVTLEALEGAYLSKVGRLIECQVIAS